MAPKRAISIFYRWTNSTVRAGVIFTLSRDELFAPSRHPKVVSLVKQINVIATDAPDNITISRQVEQMQYVNIKAKWNERYRAATGAPQATQVLKENLHLLPGHGRALDLACGLGANAILMAQQGLKVDAWDIADVPVAALQDAALKRQLSIQAEVRDVEAHPPDPETFDVIVVSYFLDRDIIPALVEALKPGGLIYYQTFTLQRVSERGPQREEFRLADQELLHLFSGLQLLFYREEGRIGDVDKGLRDEAMFIGRKSAIDAN